MDLTIMVILNIVVPLIGSLLMLMYRKIIASVLALFCGLPGIISAFALMSDGSLTVVSGSTTVTVISASSTFVSDWTALLAMLFGMAITPLAMVMLKFIR